MQNNVLHFFISLFAAFAFSYAALKMTNSLKKALLMGILVAGSMGILKELTDSSVDLSDLAVDALGIASGSLAFLYSFFCRFITYAPGYGPTRHL